MTFADMRLSTATLLTGLLFIAFGIAVLRTAGAAEPLIGSLIGTAIFFPFTRLMERYLA